MHFSTDALDQTLSHGVRDLYKTRRSHTQDSMSTSASSGSPSASDNEAPAGAVPLTSLMGALQIKNTFLEFPPHLFQPESPANRQRPKSAPCRVASFAVHKPTQAGSGGSAAVDVPVSAAMRHSPQLTIPPRVARPLVLSDLLALPQQTPDSGGSKGSAGSGAARKDSAWCGPSSSPRSLLSDSAESASAAVPEASPSSESTGHKLGQDAASAEPEMSLEEQMEMLDFELGSPELLSIGSAAHYFSNCKPCAFVHKKGCTSGLQCRFCHICGPEIKRRRQLERLDQKRRLWRQRARQGARQAAGIEQNSPGHRTDSAGTDGKACQA
eukprot:CAMPEP_0179058710 /NCGR_PEP_ID=MMETSP0796-20121207/24987_1 /TAXON_ID=73915 /ORGANISM="Pyrodinium bahamense, Strain pbaha01" /LENGTH=325 /DNA_ID=CAMNT_0020755463 /DNA_START=8 /DNA_END=985 /DNA_ORIENTATION=+